MDLAGKINNGSAVVGVIGLGYVGLPLLNAFHQTGHRVIGFDVDTKKIQMLKKGENYLKHLGESLLRPMLSSGRFDATADASRVGECDVLISCVPTRLAPHLEAGLSFVATTTA